MDENGKLLQKLEAFREKANKEKIDRDQVGISFIIMSNKQ